MKWTIKKLSPNQALAGLSRLLCGMKLIRLYFLKKNYGRPYGTSFSLLDFFYHKVVPTGLIRKPLAKYSVMTKIPLGMSLW